MERVFGIGGAFFRSERPDELRAWYARHLGVELEPSGAAVFRAEVGDVTVWHAFPGDTDYFPQTQAAMLNYRVRDLDAVLAQLRVARGEVKDEVYESEDGRFAWAWDPREYAAAVRALGGTPGGADFLRSQGVQGSYEHVDLTQNFAAMPDTSDLGHVRLVVLSVLEPPAGMPSHEGAVLQAVHLRLQAGLARQSTDSVHAGAPFTDHPSFLLSSFGQPELVVAALRAVVGSVRRDAPLPPCAVVFRGVKARCRS